MIDRRTLLASGGALLASAAVPKPLLAQASAGEVRRITAKAGVAHLLEDGQPTTPVWAYDGNVPGAPLRVKQGETVAVDFHNALPKPSTIHWHGLRIDNAMDGVAGLTQEAVAPGKTFSYRFTPPDAGTYWYHPHYESWEQVTRGLYGPLIVEEPDPPSVDQDLVLVIDDWRLGRDGKIHEESLGALHDRAHSGRLGNVLTINGQYAQDFPVQAGDRLRLRLVNTATDRVIGIVFEGHAPIVVALDGQPVATPIAPDRNRIVLAPAQRADLILDCDGEVGSKSGILVETGREKLEIGRLVYDASKRRRPKPLSDIAVLPQNPLLKAVNHKEARVVDLVMSGGAMAPMDGAIYKGKRYDRRELAFEHGQVWAFNGIAGMADEPLMRLERDEEVVVRMKNETQWPHAMHFHGHHVMEVAHSSRKPQPHWRDTVLLQRGETVAVAFKADNPGKWMLHCHMLSHQASGMGTWFDVA